MMVISCFISGGLSSFRKRIYCVSWLIKDVSFNLCDIDILWIRTESKMKGAWSQLCSFLHNLSHTPCGVKVHIKRLVWMDFFVAKRKQSLNISDPELLMDISLWLFRFAGQPYMVIIILALMFLLFWTVYFNV